MGKHRTWTVRMSTTEPEGRSVWENCPFAPGLDVYLHIVDLPMMALRIGDYRSRLQAANPGPGPLGLAGPTKFVNGPLVQNGPWPGDEWPLTVGCNLAVIPAFQQLGGPPLSPLITADMPIPSYWSNEGVDCRGMDEVQLWGGVLLPATDYVRLFPWVRHSTGIWAQPDNQTAPASAQATRIVVDTKQADRVYGQIIWATPPSTPAYVVYGLLTSPPTEALGDGVTYETDEITVRFGAIEAPNCGASA